MTDFLPELIRAATAADGQPPFSDQSLVDLSQGERELLSIDDRAAAIVTTGARPTEAELVVHPDARHRGLGGRLLQNVIARADGDLLVWAHGDHADARKLAARHGLEPVRELLQLRAPVGRALDRVGPPGPYRDLAPDEGGRVSRPGDEGLDTLAGARYSTNGKGARSTSNMQAFRPGVDDAAWLELNAKAFSDHPEQGRLTQHDLDARMEQDWFDADDFLLLRDGDELTGFCWLKVEGDIGEFYAVGVDPAHQGEGLGRALVAAGLQRLAERGIRVSSLYVEGDNEPAVRLYRSFGFANYSIDVQYRLER